MSTVTSSRHRIPAGPKGHFLLGHAAPLRRDALGFFAELGEHYGPVSVFKVGPRPIYLVSGAEAIERVLQENARNYLLNREAATFTTSLLGATVLSTDGDAWQRARRILTKAVGPEQFGSHLPVICRHGAAMVERWEKLADAGEPVDVDRELRFCNLSIASEVLFGIDLIDEAPALEHALDVGGEYFAYRLRTPIALPRWVPTAYHRSVAAALAYGPQLLADIVQRRRSQPTDSPDLLTRLMQAEDPETGQRFDDQQICRESLGMLIAGHETSTNALVWTLYLLHRHPGIQAQVVAEIQGCLGARCSAPADFDGLLHLRRAIDESMRIFPPTYMFGRMAIADDVLEGTLMPAGGRLMISPWVTHRLEQLWPDPLRFDPDRFLPAQVAARPRYAFFPYGGGPRVCLGRSIASKQIPLLLATILNRFRLEVLDPEPPVPVPTFSLRKQGGLHCRIIRRTT